MISRSRRQLSTPSAPTTPGAIYRWLHIAEDLPSDVDSSSRLRETRLAMCRYAQNNRSGNTGSTIARRVCETFVPHEPEGFLRRLASTNTTATASGTREAITTDNVHLSRRSFSLLRILGAAFLILEACLTAISTPVLLLFRGWRYSHQWLGVSTDRKGGGWVLSRREDRTQESQDCASCVAVDDLAGGSTAPEEGIKRNSTSKALCRKRRGSLRHVLLFAMVVGIGPAAEGQSVLLPLTPSGFQYTVGVTVSGTNYNATAALILDTALPIVGFPICEGSVRSSGDGLSCIPRISLDNFSYFSCNIDKIVRDNREITLYSDWQETSPITFLENQDIGLATTPSTPILGPVLAISGKNIEDDYQPSTVQGWNSSGGVFGLAPYSNSCEEFEESVFKVILKNLPDAYSQMFALNLSDSTSESTLQIGDHSSPLGDLLWGERHTAQHPSYWGFTAFDLSMCGRGLMNNVTSSWPAKISTGSACLGLPEEMYDSLVAWLPSCNDDPLEVCGASIDLPWLSFRLREHGKPLYIPMGSLVLEDKRLCLTRGDSIYWGDNSFKMPLITLGTLPLRSLYAVINAESNMVGLAQKPYEGEVTPQEGNETCQAAISCQGMQTFKESENSCEDPLCSAYYFTWLDEDTMTCRPSRNLIIVVWSVGIIFGVTEIIGHFLSVYYGGKGVALRGQRHQYGWEFYTGRVIDACISKASRAVGLSSRRHHD